MATPSLRILYAGILRSGSTALQRLEAMRSLGHRIEAFDTTPYHFRGGRLERSITYRLGLGPAVWTLNSDLISFAGGKRVDWVWLDKGVWVTPGTLHRIRDVTGAMLVHYTPDPAIVFHRTRQFMRSIPVYDVLITSKPFEMEAYREHGARRLILLPQGYDPALFRPHDVQPELLARVRSDVCFIGHCEDHYLECVRLAAEVSDNVALWGPWQRRLRKNPWLSRVLRGNGIWHHEYATALCGAKIGLGLLSKWIPETSTTRTFEIPACGTFLLAERTGEHEGFFKEGVEAEFFGSGEELQDKLRYYLSHDEARQRIAQAGRERCLKGGYSYADRMRQCVEMILREREPAKAGA